ncbi:MAG: hypothetical protein NT068_00480 [Candidatus Nomurabacteria bacterium]|nr:hypothetical protein [Candidatus Nomurabacteria bacterium]
MALVGNAYQRRLSPARIFWTKNLNQDDLRYYRDSATYMAPISFNGNEINMAGVDSKGNAHFILHRNSKPGETAVFVIMKIMYGEYEDYPGQLADAPTISGYCCNPFYVLRKRDVNHSVQPVKSVRPVAPVPVSESNPVTLNNSGYNNNQIIVHDTVYVSSGNQSQENFESGNSYGGGQKVRGSTSTTYVWTSPLRGYSHFDYNQHRRARFVVYSNINNCQVDYFPQQSNCVGNNSHKHQTHRSHSVCKN